jgi:hypothetical protein
MATLLTDKFTNEPQLQEMKEGNHQSTCRNIDVLFMSSLRDFNSSVKIPMIEEDSKSFILGYN